MASTIFPLPQPAIGGYRDKATGSDAVETADTSLIRWKKSLVQAIRLVAVPTLLLNKHRICY